MSVSSNAAPETSSLAPARSIVVGTAGHIDHGKTALVKALTGIDADRLKEEKARGITIELGFAHFILPGGENVALVDVPGHERFIKNMVAGASGIDYVLFVVAADEGVMPQTREHLDICCLLNISSGLVVLTKVDLVDRDFLELAVEDVSGLVEGTFLESAPILPVSSATGEGLEALLAAMGRMAAENPPKRSSGGIFRLSVDRVFSMRGFGTVVTGTVSSGTVKLDDEVEILPKRLKAKVRGIQIHGEQVGSAMAGQRTALNLGGVDVCDLKRGDVVSASGRMSPTYMIDARLELSRCCKEPLLNRARMRVHLGTQEAPSIVAFLDRDELMPGEHAYAQLRTSNQLVCSPGDRFVLRSFSPAQTTAGGVVLDSRPKKHKKGQIRVAASLKTLDRGSLPEKLEEFLMSRAFSGMSPAQVQVDLGVSRSEAESLLNQAAAAGTALLTDSRTSIFHHAEIVDGLGLRSMEMLQKYHDENPLKPGMGIEELRSRLPGYVDRKLVDFSLNRLNALGKAAIEGENVRLGDFVPHLDDAEAALGAAVKAALSVRKYQAPTLAELAAELGENAKTLESLLGFMVSNGDLIKTKEGFYLEMEAFRELAVQAVELMKKQGEIGVGDIKKITGTTRKYSIPLLECLDGKKITLRKGDVRILGSGDIF